MKKRAMILCCILMFTIFSFAEWRLDYIDGPGVGQSTSLAIDSNNCLHIGYQDVNNRYLKYIYYDGSGWQVSTIDEEEHAGSYISLALNSSDQPNIAYYNNEKKYLKYARYDGNSWQISIVDNPDMGDVGNFAALVIDDRDRPHITYYDNIKGNLNYAYYNGLDWIITIIDSEGNVGWYNSLAIDTNNHLHVSYFDYSNFDLKYAYFDGSEWKISVVDSAGWVGECSSIKVDCNNNPHISYYDYDNLDLKYAYYDGSNWQISTVDSSAYDLGRSTSMVIDNNDHIHISYFVVSGAYLKYAYYNGTSWEITIVDPNQDNGHDNSIAIDSYDNPHIAYYSNEYNSYLKYGCNIILTEIPLISFTAQPQLNSAIKLVWQVTASDSTQIVGFNLYRAGASKAHKKDWARLNSSPISGNNPYQFVDAAVQAGQSYHYRLSALTTDGKEEMLGTTQGEASTTPAVFALTAVYPNPASSLLTCRLTMPQAGSVSLGLYDISGRLVLSQRMELAGGEQETTLEVGNLARGVYNSAGVLRWGERD